MLVSIYAFFLFETLMHLCLKSKVGEHGSHSHIDAEVIVKSTNVIIKNVMMKF